MRLRLGLRPGSRWGSLQRSARLLAGFKGPTSKGNGGRGREKRRGKERGSERKGAGGEKGEGEGKGKGHSSTWVLRAALPNFSPCMQKLRVYFEVLQGVSIACYAEPCVSYDWVLCLSIRLSVTHWHWVKLWNRHKLGSRNLHQRIAQELGIKSSSRNSIGVTPNEGIKGEWGRKNSQFSANKSLYLRNGAR